MASRASVLSKRISQNFTMPCWPNLDEQLRKRLNVLHHSLGSDVADPTEAAEMFSEAVRELLLDANQLEIISTCSKRVW